MRNALIVLLMTICSVASATDYYISSSGNDSNNGISPSSPWRTIAKVNSAFSIMNPGDRILFNQGDTFYGTLLISKSGSAGSPIKIGAYGTGEKPVITGFSTLSSWANAGNGIYSKVVTCQSPPEMVTINGVQYGMGRYPNTAWLTIDSNSGNVSITDAALNSNVINWTGAEVVQRKPNLLSIDRDIITNHTGQTLSYTGSGYFEPLPDYGYFIQNDIRTLDSFGEWYYNTLTSTFYMYFGTNNPNNYIVQVSTINDLATFTSGVYYITFDNVSFKGANHNALYLNSNNNITIQNCDIDFSGYSGIRGVVAQYFTATNNTINHSNDLGIFLNGSNCNYAIISENTIRNSGLIMGLGNCQDNCGNAISLMVSSNSTIENNKIYDAGFNGINFEGSNDIIRNNFINRFCLRKEDGAGIFYGGGVAYTNMTITDNIVLNAVGSVWGRPISIKSLMAGGIYLDYYTTGGVKIKNNTVAYSKWNGIFLHGSQNVEVTNNTVYDVYNCVKLQESGTLGYPARNITMTGNIFFAKDVSHVPLRLNSSHNDFDQVGTFDNNYYARPLDNAKPIMPEVNWGGYAKSLAEWQSLYGLDPNSKISPIALEDSADIDFYYNETKTNKVITLAQPMIDVKNTKYVNSITLTPFTSVILMVDPNPDQPVIPVYSSSVIQNATPSILEMTYNVNLANVVPAASAFTVKVNSVTRTVNTVAISGTKVLLTLASPIVYGNVVTVAYTRPASNPLQTASGGQAATLSAQSVTNSVTDIVGPMPVYLSSVIESATPDILEMTYDLPLANIVPDASAFSVLISSWPRSVKSVAISGNKVLLTLPFPISYGSTVITVAYTKPATNPLQTTSGGQASTISAQPVTNNVNSVIPVYVSSVIENATPDILEMTYNLPLSNIVPDASAFSVLISSWPRSVKSVAISGNKVLLTLPFPISYGSTVITVAYTKPATNPLQISSGGQASTISAQPVTNNVNSVIPVYVSSVIENATPDILEMTYNLPLSNIIPDASAFSVLISSWPRSVKSVAISGNKVLLTLPFPISYGSTVITVAYTKPATNPLQISSGGQASTISAQPVTNNVNFVISGSKSSVIGNSTLTSNKSPIVSILLSGKNSSLISPATIVIEAVASDPDGTISKVEFFNENRKLAELTTSPYSYTWKDVAAGNYLITAIATDNLNTTTTSSPIKVGVDTFYESNPLILNLYPNPNDGHFSIELFNPLQNEKSEITITTLEGKHIYKGTFLKEETIKQFDLSYIKSGIYILMINNKEISITKKFIKK